MQSTQSNQINVQLPVCVCVFVCAHLHISIKIYLPGHSLGISYVYSHLKTIFITFPAYEEEAIFFIRLLQPFGKSHAIFVAFPGYVCVCVLRLSSG